MFRPVYLVLLACVLVIAAGQLAFKLAASWLRIDWGLPLLSNLQNNWKAVAMVGMALMLYAASTIAWVLSLRTVPLSLAFMFNSISFALVPAAAFLLFGEPIPRFFWWGTACIVVGLALILVPGAKLE